MQTTKLNNLILRFSNLNFMRVLIALVVIVFLLLIINSSIGVDESTLDKNVRIAAERIYRNQPYTSPVDLDYEVQKDIEDLFTKNNRLDMFYPNANYIRNEIVNHSQMSKIEYENLISGLVSSIDFLIPIINEKYSISFNHLEQLYEVVINDEGNYQDIKQEVLNLFAGYYVNDDMIKFIN